MQYYNLKKGKSCICNINNVLKTKSMSMNHMLLSLIPPPPFSEYSDHGNFLAVFAPLFISFLLSLFKAGLMEAECHVGKGKVASPGLKHSPTLSGH